MGCLEASTWGLLLPGVLINEVGKGRITDVVHFQITELFRSAKAAVLWSEGIPIRQGDEQDNSK